MRIWNWFKGLFTRKPTPTPSKPMIEEGEFTPQKYKAHYIRLWSTMQIKPEKKPIVKWYVNKIKEGAERYREVERETGVPWQVIGCKHLMEGAGDFSRVLHNGERIIGTSKKTRLVPKNRGPFDSWEEAAIDALRIKNQPKEWTIENTLYYCERFNGLAYLRDPSKPNSPYIWSFTQHYTKGKYYADHKYSPTLVSKQCGIAPVLKELGFIFQGA